MGHTHEHIITALQSNNVRHRQDALSQMEEAFADEAITSKLTRAEDWIAVFDGLSRFVSIETATCMKKGWDKVATVSLKRLEKAGSVIRMGAEKYTEWFHYKVVKVLVKYLMEGMVDKRRDHLLPSLALNYIKAMVALFRYPPHLEHLEDDTWISLVSLAFAVILNGSLLGGRGFDDDPFDDSMNNDRLPSNEVGSEDEDDDEDEAMNGFSAGSKRPRAPSRPLHSASRTLSPEQIEFMGLLTLLLRSPYAPLLHDGIAQKILQRLQRFFELYPTWSIAHTNAIMSVNVVLGEVELNMIRATSDFALKMWSPLLSYWSGKERRDKVIKEELVIAMTTFLPLALATKASMDTSNEVSDRVDELYSCLEDDVNNSTFEGLQLESLRLHFHSGEHDNGPFGRRSFQSGMKFDRQQAYSWVLLELYSDCIIAMHGLTGEASADDDGMTCSTLDSTRRKRRRRSRRASSPLQDITDCIIKSDTSTKKRSDILQALLFIVDRYWSCLTEELQKEIFRGFSICLTYEDVVVQSWAFLCLAAILSVELRKPNDKFDWHAIWLQAVHKTSVLGVGRAAAHVAHAILTTQQLPLHVILPDLEAFASNLVIQSPSFPFDSTCAFLCDCLRIASQDMKLYRTHLPDTVIIWLSQNWNVMGSDFRFQLPNHTIGDVVSLLEEVCSLSKRSKIYVRQILPESVITDVVVERHRTQQHRDFLLHTRLKHFDLPDDHYPSGHKEDTSVITDAPLVKPATRESRISDLLIRFADRLVEDLSSAQGVSIDLTPERLRRTIDLVVVIFYWEATLVVNGIQSNRRAIRTACNIMTLVTPSLALSKWKPHELAMFLGGLDALVSDGNSRRFDDPWDVMVRPGTASGVKRSVLSKLANKISGGPLFKRELQETVWKSADIQDAFKIVTNSLSNVVKLVSAIEPPAEHGEGDDGFGRIQVASATSSTSRALNRMKALCIDMCLNFLTAVPMLQSGMQTPIRDQSLVDLVMQEEHQAFLAIAPYYLECIRRKQAHFSDSIADKFVDVLHLLALRLYATSESLASHLLAIQFLDSTLQFWIKDDEPDGKLMVAIRSVHALLRKWISRGKLEASWKLRDSVICYLDHYLENDPRERIWKLPLIKKDGTVGTSVEEDTTPSHLLPEMADDPDSRVRFRAAVANAHLLLTADKVQCNTGELYYIVFRALTQLVDKYERMQTRFIHLGNAMVISSEIRRGPYWHLLETYTADENNVYTSSLVAVLTAVATRLGLGDLRHLFEAYASTTIGALIENEADIFTFPMDLIGYKSTREWGLSAFRLLAPTTLATTAFNGETVECAQRMFSNQCYQARKSSSEGIAECFPSAVSIIALTAISRCGLNEQISRGIHAELTRLAGNIQEGDDTRARITRELDSAVFAALRTLSDTDYSPNSLIFQTLTTWHPSGKPAQTFIRLNRYRKPEDFAMHGPNLPAFTANIVLGTLRWLEEYVNHRFDAELAYHVIYRIAACIEEIPLVNEQIRLLQALSVWISICHELFLEPMLLSVLLRTTIPLLAQFDLAHSAQGIISWALKCYRASSHIREAMLPELLGRIATICHDYIRSPNDPFCNAFGEELLDWIEGELLLMGETLIEDPSAGLIALLDRTLPLWPRQPKDKLADRYLLATDAPSTILQSAYSSSAKFRLVRYLRDLSRTAGYSLADFSKRDFVYLKNSIPSLDEIQEDDAAAFLDLVYDSAGQICSPQAESNTAFYPNGLKVVTSLDGKGKMLNPKDSAPWVIMMLLLDILSNGSAARVNEAYHTLRVLFGNSFASIVKGSGLWPRRYAREVVYLGKYPPSPLAFPSRTFSDFLSSEIFQAHDFDSWVKGFAGLLTEVLGAKVSFYGQLAMFIRKDADFAEQVVPLLVHQVTYSHGEQARTVLSDHFTSTLQSGQSDRCRVIVDTVLWLRNFSSDRLENDPLSYNKWLNVDYQLLSRGAMAAGAYTTALLFLELANEYQPEADVLAVNEDILYNIYTHIEEPDGFYGIASKDVRRFLTRRFYHEGQWDMAFKFHNAEFAAGESGQEEGIYRSLHFNGYDKLAVGVLQSFGSNAVSSDESELGYELAWRTQMWDLPDPRDDSQPGAALYTALRAIHRSKDQRSIDEELRRAIHTQMTQLSRIGDEDMRTIRSKLQSLVCLGEIRKWRQILQDDQASQTINAELQSSFADVPSNFEFTFLESIVATRMSLLRCTLRLERIGDVLTPFGHQLKDVERRCLVSLSQAARQAGKGQIALNAITEAQKLDPLPIFDVSEEFANVLWLQNEHRAAVDYLRNLAVNSEPSEWDPDKVLRYSLILSRLGTWCAEASIQRPTDIREQYFEPAAQALVHHQFDGDFGSKLATIFHQFAMFAEERYHAILNSPEVVRLRIYTQRLESLQMGGLWGLWEDGQPDKDKERKLKVQHEEDKKQLVFHMEARRIFLQQAIEMFSRCLQASDDFNDNAVVRLCSLWFANFPGDEVIQNYFGGGIQNVPSWKFLVLSRQLCARLGDFAEKPQKYLQPLITRMCKEHPFHSVYQLWAMQDPETLLGFSRRTSRGIPTRSARAQAAHKILTSCQENGESNQRVKDVSFVCQAYLNWAKYPVRNNKTYKDTKRSQWPVPSDVPLKRLKDVAVPVATSTVPIDPSMQYNNTVTIRRYSDNFQIAGGQSKPKISECIGSDGQVYKQLFKGEGGDDMRQDAVMMQVFELVDLFLRRDRRTKARSLRFRCYKIIPLASQAGLMEFVKDTLVLGSWLKPAHRRYRPQDIPDPAPIMKDWRAEPNKYPPQELYRCFMELKQKFRPVFRHFFTERHKQPMAWFATRLNYTRSCATTSIAGHILGLGDRHLQNILIDNNTGELVHIDFGIAFDQGMLLPIPEIIPFRLTEDTVDGFGMTGTEGVFRRCVEETLRVLRVQSGVIITILEVFRHDPLHSWTVDAEKIKKVQGTGEAGTATTAITTAHGPTALVQIGIDSDQADEAADRALSSVRRKLDQSLSVEYTVNELITAATDPANLSQLFAGWSPYM